MRIHALAFLVLVSLLIFVISIDRAEWCNTFGVTKTGVSYRYTNNERRVLLLHSLLVFSCSLKSLYKGYRLFDERSPVYREYRLPVVYCNSFIFLLFYYD